MVLFPNERAREITLADGTAQRLCSKCEHYLLESAFSASCVPNKRYVCRACMSSSRRQWAKTAKVANYVVVASRSREKRRCTQEHVEPSKVLSAEIDLLLDVAQHRSVLDEPVVAPAAADATVATTVTTDTYVSAASLAGESDDTQPGTQAPTTTTTTTAMASGDYDDISDIVSETASTSTSTTTTAASVPVPTPVQSPVPSTMDYKFFDYESESDSDTESNESPFASTSTTTTTTAAEAVPEGKDRLTIDRIDYDTPLSIIDGNACVLRMSEAVRRARAYKRNRVDLLAGEQRARAKTLVETAAKRLKMTTTN